MAGLSVAVVTLGASLYQATGPAQAASVGDAQAQLQSLQAEVVSQAGRIRALTLAYEQADSRAAALAQQVAQDQADLARLRRTESATAAQLRAEAIISYTGGVATEPVPSMSGSADPAIRAEYLQVAVGDLTDAVDAYRTQEKQVASAEAALAGDLRASQNAARAVDSARRSALAEAGQIQAQLVSVQTRLQQLEAAQAAAQAAAAARAQAAAAAAAAARTAYQGLPVNGGLLTVVRNVVAPAPAPAGGNAGGVWLQLRQCESGNDYQANTGNGFYGAYQFSQQTWTGLGYPGRPDLEPPAMQDQAAQKLQAERGWGQWPACSAALGLS